MASFVELSGDPDDVRDDAARMTAQGQAIAAKTEKLLTDIAAIEAEAPWGHDKFGEAFLGSYGDVNGQGPTDASHIKEAATRGTAREDLESRARQVGHDMAELGDAVTWAVSGVEVADSEAAGDIGRTV